MYSFYRFLNLRLLKNKKKFLILKKGSLRRRESKCLGRSSRVTTPTFASWPPGKRDMRGLLGSSMIRRKPISIQAVVLSRG